MKSNNSIIVTTSWDDGHPTDIKLADLLLEYGLSGTFYVAPHNRERSFMSLSELRDLSDHFEIGAHTLTHPDLRRLNDQQLESEIIGSKVELENVLGIPVQMFCYPRGCHNRRVRRVVVNAGFIGARTMKEFHIIPGDDAAQMATTILAFPLPSWIRLRHELKTFNWCGLRKYLQIGLGRTWVEQAITLFEEVLENGGVWHLWGHAWEIEEYQLWDGLRLVLDRVANRQNVRYLTNEQVISKLEKFTF